MQYYTGFDNYNNFIYVFNVLRSATGHIGLANCGLSLPNQFFLTLIKLRQAKDDYEISLLMGVSKKTISHIFTVWVNFLYNQLKEINIWPTKAVVECNMPTNFKKQFPATRVSLDATEVPIQKTQNTCAQSATFSLYKNKNHIESNGLLHTKRFSEVPL